MFQTPTLSGGLVKKFVLVGRWFNPRKAGGFLRRQRLGGGGGFLLRVETTFDQGADFVCGLMLSLLTHE